ncbi:MAG: hypothetical protein ACXW5U_31765 [Thermoanaerobaculia bacterium]
MGEPITRIAFSFEEIAEALVKKQGLHQGFWGLYVEFGIGAINVGPTSAELQPTAMVPVLSLGLQTFEAKTNLSVDASVVNPAD